MKWLCRLGMHNWKYYGESIVASWKEPLYGSGRMWARFARIRRYSQIHMRTRGKKVFAKRKCLRCGIDMKRIMVKETDGTLSCIGWEPLSESEIRNDEGKEPQRKVTKRRMIR